MLDLHRDIEAALRIDTLPKILDAACSLVGLRRATFARVTETRWVACGIRDSNIVEVCSGIELDVKTTICDAVRRTGRPVIVNSVVEDPIYRHHPGPIAHHFESIIAVPVYFQDGSFFGTLSALGDAPAILDAPETLRSFELFADLLSLNLARELQLESSRKELADERHTSQLREQFIAVLGHDLRNPLASVRTAAFVLRRKPEAAELADLIEKSVMRMSGLIDDVMDFARGKLGDGMSVKLDGPTSLLPIVSQLVRELEAAHPERQFDVDVALDEPVAFDQGRLSQLLCNLLGNAVIHGDPTQPVRVGGSVRGGIVEISVSNAGQPIPVHAMGMLFQPFVRASVVKDREGLGLGLFIASEIARAHGGNIKVSSGPAETKFTFWMPATPSTADDLALIDAPASDGAPAVVRRELMSVR